MATASADLFPFACPGCHAAIAVPASLVGHPAACPVCTAGFVTRPLPTEPPAAAQTAPPRKPRRFDFREPPPKTIGTEHGMIELRRLTPEEKAARRVRRNLITLAIGSAFLLSIVLVATRPKKKPRRSR